ncbi:SDR family oxidoreductase [Otoolea muris]|uniref:SDR family oxidoreductase n=1 Tax=Otoolea muris TaxID=2941515 RepID=UPI00203B8C78|nr:SDR family oxidoreductase [Otoolea muris]
MRILLLGSNGMLGQSLRKELCDYEVTGVDLQGADYQFDLSDDMRLTDCISSLRPEIVINAAALVDLNICETDPGKAYISNTRLPGVLANICRRNNSYLIHISTDHFYTGDGKKKHMETDPVVLVNEYARTKYAGEYMALAYENTLILRTNIVGFRGRQIKPTFIEWVIEKIKGNEEFILFNDFYTSSMHTSDFSKVLKKLLNLRPRGVYNLASSTVSSKEQFVNRLAELLFGYKPASQIGSVKNLKGIQRGDSLGLDTRKIEKLLGIKLPDLEETLASIKKEYLERNA